jgi:hypothetical protein
LYAREVPTTQIAERNAQQWENARCYLTQASQLPSTSQLIFLLADVELSGEEAVYSEIGLTARHVDWILADQVHLLVNAQPELSMLQGVPLTVLDSSAALPSPSRTVFVADLQVPCSRLD